MRYYIRFLLVAVFCGFFSIFNYTKNVSEITVSDIILMTGLNGVDYYPQYLPEITYWFVPLLLFQIFFGTYIYRHFCSASVYFFSRNCKRISWFLKEVIKLYLFVLMYLFIMIFSGILITGIFVKVIIDEVFFLIFIYYLLVYSLFLLVTTLGINILAVVFGSNIGFVIVESIIIFGITVFSIIGNYFIIEEALLDKYTWILKLNPVSHIIFSVHSSKINSINELINKKSITFDLDLSVLMLLIASVIVIICGCFVISRHDFVDINKETGGI